MNLDPTKLIEVAVVGFLFYTHMIIISRKLDKLADAIYSMSGQNSGKKKEETR